MIDCSFILDTYLMLLSDLIVSQSVPMKDYQTTMLINAGVVVDLLEEREIQDYKSYYSLHIAN